MILICQPERFGLPSVPSERAHCGRCGAAVWVSKTATARQLEELTGILCVVCAMSVVKVGDRLEPAPWVTEDLEEELKP